MSITTAQQVEYGIHLAQQLPEGAIMRDMAGEIVKLRAQLAAARERVETITQEEFGKALAYLQAARGADVWSSRDFLSGLVRDWHLTVDEK